MIKRLIPVVVILVWLIPSVSMALGLGPITMRSALNQPLLAEIDIHSVQPGDLDGLAVKLASEEDFQRVNVERPSYLNRIKFKIAYRADGSAYIHLTTEEAVTEPYLDFLIEARWPRGRALKEYTVLVDPPVLAAEAPAPIEQAATTPVFTPPEPKPATRPQAAPRQSAPQPRREAQRPTTSKPRPAATPRQIPSGAAGPLDYGVVKRGDTLWEIADELRQRSGSDASIHQMMMALLRANPNAFVNGNVNQLKAGYVLRIDDEEKVSAVSNSEAVAEFRQQYREWRSGTGRLVQQVEVASAGMEEAAEPSTTRKARAAADQSKLKLVAPGTEKQGAGGAADCTEAQQLRDDLILATEALDASRQESDELKTRMTELDEQLESMQRLIMLKDEEMLALQNQLKNQPEAAVKPPAAQAEQAKKPQPAPASEVETASSGFFSDYLLVGVALLVLIGVVAWLVIRRRKMQEGFEESILNVGMGSAVASAAAYGSHAVGDSGESSMVSDFAMSDMGGIQSDAAEVDPISEADVYLAYGRHQQAEDIIKQALETNPRRLELHAKLLEVYHAAKNPGAFEEHAQLLHDQIRGDESNEYWQRIVGLGSELCPGNPLFGGGRMPSVSEAVAGTLGNVTADEEDLLDFDFNEDEITELESAAHNVVSDEDNSLDFDVSSLDFSLDDEGEDQKTAMHDNSLDFDMPSSFAAKAAHDEDATALNLSLDAGSNVDLGSIDFEMDNEVLADVPTEAFKKPAEMDLSLEDFDNEETLHASGDDDMGLSLADSSSFDASELSLEDLGEDEDLGDDIFSDVDEIGTKLDLAKAYVDMGDSDGARSILDEVLEEGDDSQKEQAQELLRQMG